MQSMIQVTDLHITAKAGEKLRGLDTRDSFRRIVEQICRQQPALDALLLTGDIADDGSASAYEFLNAALADFNCPLLCIPGNHDLPDVMARTLDPDRFTCNGPVTLGEHWRIELLDSHVPGEVSGRLSESSRAQLQEMRDGEDHRSRLLALHHPPVTLGSAWLDGSGLQSPDELFDPIDNDARVRAAVWGHAHQCWEGRRHNALMLGTPSTCTQFLPGSDAFAIDEDRPPAFRWLGLHDNGRVETEVRWLGR
jgi:Icc protein